MALPRVNVPQYELELPSTKEKITYRPFLVKEEKILLLALEEGDDESIARALKQIVHNYCEIVSLIFLQLKQDSKQLFPVVQNFQYRASLGILRSILKLLWITFLFLVAICTSSLLSLTKLIWPKLTKRFSNTNIRVLVRLRIACQWVGVKLSIWKIEQKLQKNVSEKVTVTRRDYM